jgi:hypothetical protein
VDDVRDLPGVRRRLRSPVNFWPIREEGGSSGICSTSRSSCCSILRPLRLLSLAVVIEVLGRAVGDTFR